MHRGVLAEVPPGRDTDVGIAGVDALELGEPSHPSSRRRRRGDLVGAAERREGLGEPLLELVEASRPRRRASRSPRALVGASPSMLSSALRVSGRVRLGHIPLQASPRGPGDATGDRPSGDLPRRAVVRDASRRRGGHAGAAVTYLPSGHRSRSRRAPTGGRTPGTGKAAGVATVLMLRRPADARSRSWHFWDGPPPALAGPRLEEPFRRTATGYDTADLELDIYKSPQAGRGGSETRGSSTSASGTAATPSSSATRSVRWETTSARARCAASGGGTTGGPASSPTRRGVRPPCLGVGERARCLPRPRRTRTGRSTDPTKRPAAVPGGPGTARHSRAPSPRPAGSTPPRASASCRSLHRDVGRTGPSARGCTTSSRGAA